MSDPRILTVEELSRELKLSRRWLWQEAKAGRIPSLTAGKRRIFNLAAVEAALADRASKGGRS